jgi:hypothetical protein
VYSRGLARSFVRDGALKKASYVFRAGAPRAQLQEMADEAVSQLA